MPSSIHNVQIQAFVDQDTRRGEEPCWTTVARQVEALSDLSFGGSRPVSARLSCSANACESSSSREINGMELLGLDIAQLQTYDLYVQKR